MTKEGAPWLGVSSFVIHISFMITITGQIQDATGAALHATIDFVSKSTPLAGGGVVTTNTDARILSNPSDGTFSVELAPGNYQVTVAANGQSTTFNIAVPAGNSSMTIDTLVTTPLVYPYVAPNVLWNGQWAGNITFLPASAPPAPTAAQVTYAGGNIQRGGERTLFLLDLLRDAERRDGVESRAGVDGKRHAHREPGEPHRARRQSHQRHQRASLAHLR